MIDRGRAIDWGKTSEDYASHRPGPPPSFYARLLALGVGRPGQRILDLGTGTGELARTFAVGKSRVAGVDVSARQLAAARELAREQDLEIGLCRAPAEELPFSKASFDVVCANQCWLYFDLARAIPEVRRVLAPGGRLVTSHFSYLPRRSAIAQASERLVLEYNPDWSGVDWDGRVPAHPRWSRDVFNVRAFFAYDEAIPFSRLSWRGRMRALRGIGASLSDEQVRAFDLEHAALLEEIAPPEFTLVHRIDAHLFEFREDEGLPPL